LRRALKSLVESFPDLMALVEPLLVVRRVLREQIAILVSVVNTNWRATTHRGSDSSRIAPLR
jgi:hypothetical protein